MKKNGTVTSSFTTQKFHRISYLKPATDSLVTEVKELHEEAHDEQGAPKRRIALLQPGIVGVRDVDRLVTLHEPQVLSETVFDQPVVASDAIHNGRQALNRRNDYRLRLPHDQLHNVFLQLGKEGFARVFHQRHDDFQDIRRTAHDLLSFEVL